MYMHSTEAAGGNVTLGTIRANAKRQVTNVLYVYRVIDNILTRKPRR